jgi:hypothetical protein
MGSSAESFRSSLALVCDSYMYEQNLTDLKPSHRIEPMTYTIERAHHGKSDWEYLDSAHDLLAARSKCRDFMRSNHHSVGFYSFRAFPSDGSGMDKDCVHLVGQMDEWRYNSRP